MLEHGKGSVEYTDTLESIELGEDEAVGILQRTSGEGSRLCLRDFRVGREDVKPRTVFFSERAEEDLKGIFGDVESRIGKMVVVRTDEGDQDGNAVWYAMEVMSPDEF